MNDQDIVDALVEALRKSYAALKLESADCPWCSGVISASEEWHLDTCIAVEYRLYGTNCTIYPDKDAPQEARAGRIVARPKSLSGVGFIPLRDTSYSYSRSYTWNGKEYLPIPPEVGERKSIQWSVTFAPIEIDDEEDPGQVGPR